MPTSLVGFFVFGGAYRDIVFLLSLARVPKKLAHHTASVESLQCDRPPKKEHDSIMNEKNRNAIKWVAIIGSIIVYLGFIVYAETHFFSLVTRFLPSEAQVVGLAAVGVTLITSIALPLAIHFWVRDGKQRVCAWLFYGTHLAITFANLVLNSALNSGNQISPTFSVIYGAYILPGLVVIYVLGWIVIWAFDSSAQRAERKAELYEIEEDGKYRRKEILITSQNTALENAFQSPAAQAAVNHWAAANAPAMLAAELGLTVDEFGVGNKQFVFWDAEASTNTTPLALPLPQSNQDLGKWLAQHPTFAKMLTDFLASQQANPPS